MSDLESIDRDDLLQEIQELLPNPIRYETQLDGDFVLVGGDPEYPGVGISRGTQGDAGDVAETVPVV